VEKRKVVIGVYDTATHGWTLTGYSLAPAEQKTNFIDIPGGDGAWDLSTALTDNLPRYNTRVLTITLECSEGSRQDRELLISGMINQLDGMRLETVLPDDLDHYVVGRIHVTKEYNDLAHAAVTVTATCDPWRYNQTLTTGTFTAGTEEHTVILPNNGRLAVIPTLKVEGEGASILLVCGAASKSFSPGTYQWPDLMIPPGGQTLTYSGTGSFTTTYREAVLE